MAITPLELDLLPLSAWFPSAKRKLIIAGPCGAESEMQVMETARDISSLGKVNLFRAGVWKPRTRPGSFEGMGEEALKWLQRVKKEFRLPVTIEVATTEHVELALKYGIDVLWIGARTTVNPFSVQEIADALKGIDIPVLVKNPVNPDLPLWKGALERVNRAGIKKLGAIHRGFHTAVKTQYRNAPMWELAIDLKAACPQLPVLCDPSHISGRRDLISSVAQRAFDLDMNGLMIETHCDPATALSDAAQQLTPDQLDELLESLVMRDAYIGDAGFEHMLRTLREVIDEIDQELIQAFARRMDVVERIGEFKADHGVTILQIDRWLEILKTRTAAGESLGIDHDLIVDLCQLLHKASIRKQTEVMNQSESSRQ
ncbi:MAG: bifunctional 3-deoxy-7-phosphoheptulonate synthase/chorismate mutase type II [Bacteroidetes bacterium]|nr:bifunctional 3-deoxy-7-phosphoheptulonate synthase/chorismate mutase type II [Bacteroidota bacterium]